MKTCTVCNTNKPLEAFYPSKQSVDGRYSMCRSCHKAQAIKHQKETPRPAYNRIKEVCDQKNVTMTELAKYIGMSYTSTSKYATNFYQPSIINLHKMAQILKVNPGELLNKTI